MAETEPTQHYKHILQPEERLNIKVLESKDLHCAL